MNDSPDATIALQHEQWGFVYWYLLMERYSVTHTIKNRLTFAICEKG
jgi:hypothetical protein